MSRSSTGPGPRILVDFLFLGAVVLGGLFVIYKGVSLVFGGVDAPELAVGMSAPLDGYAQEPPKGLTIRLSEGAPREAPATPTPVTEPLSRDEVRQVLARVPPLPEDPRAERDFALSPGLVPPPRRGVTVQAEFPPAEERERREEVVSGPLDVVRHAPEGEVERARELSITFSQPMVPVTSHEVLAARDVPARLRPQVEGRWRWVGTRTLLFEVDAGFPMATEYQALVPAGVTSAVGARLAEPLAWTFKTPPPSVTESLPHGDAIADSPLMFVAFDQRIDAGAVLDHITVRAAGRTFKVRRADREEIAEDERVEQATKTAPEGRWVAFRAVRPLPRDSRVEVVIEPGTPSAEGPLRTDTAQTFSFRTFGPLRVERSWCGWDRRCPPGSAWRIEFSNPIDREAFNESLIRVEPELPLMRYRLSNDRLAIYGRVEPRRDYRVTLSADVRDVFGQTLGQETTLRFEVDAAPASLTARGERFIVLDPLAPRELSVNSVNVRALRIRIYRVQPQDWPAFDEAYRRNRYSEESWDPPGLLAVERTIPVGVEPDVPAETRIDLEPTLSNGLGHLVVAVEPTDWPAGSGRRQSIYAWLQSTRISVSALADPREVTGWVTALEGAAPLAGATLELLPAGARATTDSDGLASLPLPTARRRDSHPALIARLDGDVALLPIRLWSGVRRDALGWYVFTDRPLYRPGEEVHIKGWLRRIGAGETGDVELPRNSISQVTYTVVGSQGNELAKGRAVVNDLAGFDTEFRLPEEMNLGPVSIRLETVGAVSDLDGRTHVHYFQIEEFRRPEFEVSVSHDPGPHILGGVALFTVAASYFAGGGLPDSELNWRVESRPARFHPPNRDDFTFGGSVGYGGGAVEEFESRTDLDGEHHLRVDLLKADPPVPMSLRATATVLDVNRQAWTETAHLIVHPAELSVGLRSPRRFVRAGEPLMVEAIVVDLDGEAVRGRPVDVEATYWTWKLVDGEWRSEESEPQRCRFESTAEPSRCEFETPAGGVYRVRAMVEDDEGRESLSELRPWVGGGFYVRGRIGEEVVELIADRDEYQPDDTAEILVQAPFFPAQGVMTLRRAGIVSAERFSMDGPSHVLRVPIVEAHIPNLHVHVDLVAAADGASGVFDPDQHAEGDINLSIPPRARTLALGAVPRAKDLQPGEETVVDIELLDAADRPVRDGDVVVAVVDEAVLALRPGAVRNPVETFHPQRPADATGLHLRASVLLGPRPDPKAGRGDRGVVEGTVTETEEGDPLGGVKVYLEGTSYVTLTRADGTYSIENVTPGRYTAVAELLGYQTGYDRIAVLADQSSSTNFGLAPQTRGYMFREVMVEGVAMPAAADIPPAEAIGEAAGIRLRTDFAALAVFVGSARTDANGHVEIPVRVPDNLTRYRVIALAAAGAKQFGKGESTITVGLPLMARPSAPRFLNFGDRIEFPVVVQNRTDEALQVDVAVRATNLEWIEGQGRRVDVPAQGRVEVRFPATTYRAGTARVQVAAAAGEQADAAMVQLPVWTPATTEAFATYGELEDRAAAIPVAAPGDVFEQFGGLEVTTSSTALQALTDALLYLHSYPFECAEQISSRILAVAALRDVLTAFEAEGLPEPEELVAAVERDIKKLAELQQGDGGFSFWGGRDDSWPYVSIHAAHAIERARQKGFQVPVDLRENVFRYLREIERRIPSWYSESVRRTLIAYALYVRQLMGDSDPAAADRLIAEAGLENLPLEATGWLLAVLSGEREYSREVSSIRRHLENRASETAATAQFTSGYGDGDYLVLHSSRRTDAVILEALIIDQPRNDLIPKLVRGLLGHRRRGRWLNTQENVFVLLALDRYFNTFERVTPDFAARIWLGEDYAGGHEFRGRTTERHQIDVPMEWLAERTGTQNLIVGRQGRGRLYYRVGLRYAPADLMLDAAEHGFSVERMYQAVDDPADVRREEDGTWVIRAGARVKVLLTMAAPARRYHVALVDPLPAGLEALNPELAGAETYEPRAERDELLTPGLEPYRWYYWYRWYEHENLRDERVEVFTSLLYGGVRTYSYLARATTPGTFVVPPPKAEEMYHPETFGRGASDWIVVR
ncbi:MAG: carboxypeptidase regulatory-like domain-containing protein [Gemmatimonadota bacterium]|nr:MAG: carboxypeptidase regulatory-like domain-containing protein [Gemmatimonadota bacterium]